MDTGELNLGQHAYRRVQTVWCRHDQAHEHGASSITGIGEIIDDFWR